MYNTLITVSLLFSCLGTLVHSQPNVEGNFAFASALPGDNPPRVRKPPYTLSPVPCAAQHQRVTNDLADNMCGDLNKGLIPLNPMGQQPMGQPYPFDLIRNSTLAFLRRSLPILKQDPRLPKKTKLNRAPLPLPPPPPPHPNQGFVPSSIRRQRRQVPNNQGNQPFPHNRPVPFPLPVPIINAASNRSFPAAYPPPPPAPDSRISPGAPYPGPPPHMQQADNCEGMICRFWEMLSGNKPNLNRNGIENNEVEPSGPPTPCPSISEYGTPLFAKNYRGIWRYIVQIPSEGYFTQTVELTKCLQQKCSYMDGSCLSSTRWVSLLSAEIFYPTALMPSLPPLPRPTTPQPHLDIPIPPVYDFMNFQQYLNTRAGLEMSPSSPPTASTPSMPSAMTSKEPSVVCDGYDQQGCFQVRMFYDWFLVPGACKCWRPLARNVFMRN